MLKGEFICYLVIALIVIRLPVIGKYFRLLNTLIHELGHAWMSLLTSGKVYKVQIFSDTSGVAVTGTNGWLSSVLTSLAGYVFSSVMALFYVYLIYLGKYTWIVYSLIALVIICMVLWVRNWFGFMWCTVFLGITMLIYMYGSNTLLVGYLMLVVAIHLVESVYSSVVVFWLSVKNPSNSGDAYNLYQRTYIPSFIWGLFFMIQSFYFLGIGVKYWV